MPPRSKVKQAEARIAAADAAVLGAMSGAMMQKIAGPASNAHELSRSSKSRGPNAVPTPAFISHTTEQLHAHLGRQQPRSAVCPAQCVQVPKTASEVRDGNKKVEHSVTASYAY